MGPMGGQFREFFSKVVGRGHRFAAYLPLSAAQSLAANDLPVWDHWGKF